MAILVPRRIPHRQKPQSPQIDWSNLLNEELVAWWLFHEGAGNTLRDIARNNNGALTNNPVWEVGRLGYALDFDGSDDYVDVGSNTIISSSAPFSLSLRLKQDNFQSNRSLITLADSSAGTAFEVFTHTNSTDYGPIAFGSQGGAFPRAHPSEDFSSEVTSWAHLVITYAGGGVIGDYVLYWNGEPKSLISASLFANIGNVTRIGKLGTGNFFWNGLLDDIRIYNRVLTTADVQSLFQNPLGGLQPRRRWVPVVIQGGATVSVGLASELSTAQAISRLKQKAVGLSAETDTALATSPAKVTAVGLSTETDTAFSILRSKIKSAGLSTETDAAFALIIGSAVNVGLSDETDSALAINRLKQNPVGLSTETDTALSIGRSKIKISGLGIETDVAFTISRSKLKSLGLSSELDEALAISSSGSLAVGLASELDVALVIGRLKQQILGLPTETDLSQPVNKIKTQQAGLSVESDSALDVTGSSGRVVGLAAETDLAQSISRIKQKLIGLAPETDVALAVTIAGVTVVINTSAKETLKLLAENPTLTLSAENATLTLT